MKTPSVVFDVDGTLIDSKPGILGCLKSVSEAFGLNNAGVQEWVIGPPAEESIKVLMPEHSTEARGKFLKAYRDCYAETGWSQCELYPGIPALLEDLRRSGVKMYICTSKREDLTVRVLDHFGLRSYFKAVAGDKDGLTSHDKGALLAGLLEEENIDASRSFMVGDSAYDIRAGRSNSMETIAVLYGYGSRHDLAAAGPSALCEAPGAIYHFLESAGALG